MATPVKLSNHPVLGYRFRSRMAQTPPIETSSTPTRRYRGVDRALLLGGLLVILALFIVTPGNVLDKADHVGYAVCHQIPMRSFFFDGRQMPLCARCSGQFLGALFGMGLLLALRRGRTGLLPPTAITLTLVVFFAIWAFDGLNSYLTLFPGAPHLYEPSNLLRVTTGALQGVALISLALPFFNSTLWAETTPQRSISRWREVGLLLLIVVAIALLMASERDALLYPLALLSVGGTLMLLTVVNTMLLTLALRRDNQARCLRDVAPLLVAGLALGALELLAINLVRSWFTAKLDLPF